MNNGPTHSPRQFNPWDLREVADSINIRAQAANQKDVQQTVTDVTDDVAEATSEVTGGARSARYLRGGARFSF